jgi:hypothetical protein
MPPAVKRRLVSLAAAVSLLLCVATVALWVRSHYVGDELQWERWEGAVRRKDPGDWTHWTYTIQIAAGSVSISRDVLYGDGPNAVKTLGRFLGRSGFSYRRNPPEVPFFALAATGFAEEPLCWGFRYKHGTLPQPGWPRPALEQHNLTVPLWSLAAVFAVLPLPWVVRRVRILMRSRVGRCPKCGYDLRATPARCPECGAVPTATAAR